MNQADSERLIDALCACGYRHVNIEDADLVLVNTCSVRAKAEDKVLSYIGALVSGRPESLPKIGLAGCMGQRLGNKIFSLSRHVDFVAGTGQTGQIVEMVNRVLNGQSGLVSTSKAQADEQRVSRKSRSVSTFVTVMHGCDNFCSYCIVPYVRGPRVSRPLEDIQNEVAELIRGGTREITLLGQNVNAWGIDFKNGGRFEQLLEKTASIDGLKRLRFATSHPKYTDSGQIESLGRLVSRGIVMPHMHLPFQSGSDRVLKAMKRGYSRNDYLKIIDRLKQSVNGIAIGADVLVGFPGETEEDFNQTLSVVDKVSFDQLYMFKYSPRQGTASYRMQPLSRDVVSDRFERLKKLWHGISAKNHEMMIGRTVEIMVNGPSRKNPLSIMGRTPGNHTVILENASFEPGQLIKVKITSANPVRLGAVLVAS